MKKRKGERCYPNVTCVVCGTPMYRRPSTLAAGEGRFCSHGCFHESRSREYNPSKMPEYRVWWQMWRRCTDDKDDSFQHYGARGISVCERWRSFNNFFGDVGLRPAGTSIDRVDNNKGYEPTNCRWATPRQQAQNRPDVRLIEYLGETKCLAEWCRELGLVERNIRRRILRDGWAPVKAFTTRRDARYRVQS